MVFEGAAIGKSRQLIVQCHPSIAGDLLFEHDQDHADRDKRLLHVPHMRDDIGIGAERHDKWMNKETYCPDEEPGQDSETASALDGQTLLKFESGNGIDAR